MKEKLKIYRKYTGKNRIYRKGQIKNIQERKSKNIQERKTENKQKETTKIYRTEKKQKIYRKIKSEH